MPSGRETDRRITLRERDFDKILYSHSKKASWPKGEYHEKIKIKKKSECNICHLPPFANECPKETMWNVDVRTYITVQCVHMWLTWALLSTVDHYMLWGGAGEMQKCSFSGSS